MNKLGHKLLTQFVKYFDRVNGLVYYVEGK